MKLLFNERISPDILRILKKSQINHSREILNYNDLKDVHKYCVVNELSGQITGPLIESYIISKNFMCKNDASKCIGDATFKSKNIEIKVSTGGTANRGKFNYVQIRPLHNIDYYIFTAYYLDYSNVLEEGELFVFLIEKSKMIILLEKYGTYAHGTVNKLGKITKQSIQDNHNTEYALRPRYGDKLWSNLLEYRCTNSALPIEF